MLANQCIYSNAVPVCYSTIRVQHQFGTFLIFHVLRASLSLFMQSLAYDQGRRPGRWPGRTLPLRCPAPPGPPWPGRPRVGGSRGHSLAPPTVTKRCSRLRAPTGYGRLGVTP
jgi:hypothetical protein